MQGSSCALSNSNQTNNNILYQKIPNPSFFSGKQITISLLFEGPSAGVSIYDASLTVNQGGAISSSGLATLTVTLPDYDYQDLRIQILVPASTTIAPIAMKLELGYLSTVARKDESGNWVLNDPPPNFQQELAKCQRYFLKLTGYAWVGSGQIDYGELSGQFFIPTPVSMRALPTCSGNLRIYNGSNNMEVDITGISGYNENGANGAFTLSGFNNSSGSSVSIWLNTGESFALSADL